MHTLPPDRRAPTPGPADLVLAPFRGLRYAPDKVSGLAEVTSPPYDAIGPGSESRLLAADPHNVVRLILPHATSPGGDAGPRAAADTLRDWIGSGVLAADPRPALYVYEQQRAGAADAPGEVLQRGLIGAVRLSPPGDGIVLPHEAVMPGPVTGRRELMEATEANLEPIFLLYDGSPAGAGAARLITEVAGNREPLLTAATEDGITHRLWAVTDPAEQAAIAADLAPRQALIADGHHRYAAYLQLQERRRATGAADGPWDYGLALLVDSAAYPPRIGAMHRVIPGLAAATAADLAKAAFAIQELPGDLPGALRELEAAGRHGPAFVIAGGGTLYLADSPDPAQTAQAMPAERSSRWRALAPSVLQELLVRRLWGIDPSERTVRIVHQDAAAAVRAADGADGTAVLCNPVTADEVRDIAALGERMPPKSTLFGPKARTGLVIRTFGGG